MPRSNPRLHQGSLLLVAMAVLIIYIHIDHEAILLRGLKIGKNMNADSVMDNIRNAFERSGMTLNELGEGLGYEGPTAKKRAWFLLYRTADPRISTVLSCGPHIGCQNERSCEMRKAQSLAHCLS